MTNPQVASGYLGARHGSPVHERDPVSVDWLPAAFYTGLWPLPDRVRLEERIGKKANESL